MLNVFFPILQKWHIGIIGIRIFVNIIFYLPPGNKVWSMVMFSESLVCPQGGGEFSVWCHFLSLSRGSLLRCLCQEDPPPDTPSERWRAGGTHTIGILSWFFNEINSISCHALQTWSYPQYSYLISILQFPHGQLTAARRHHRLLAALYGQHRRSTALVLNPIAPPRMVSFFLISLITWRKLTFNVRFLQQNWIIEQKAFQCRKIAKKSSFSRYDDIDVNVS